MVDFGCGIQSELFQNCNYVVLTNCLTIKYWQTVTYGPRMLGVSSSSWGRRTLQGLLSLPDMFSSSREENHYDKCFTADILLQTSQQIGSEGKPLLCLYSECRVMVLFFFFPNKIWMVWRIGDSTFQETCSNYKKVILFSSNAVKWRCQNKSSVFPLFSP